MTNDEIEKLLNKISNQFDEDHDRTMKLIKADKIIERVVEIGRTQDPIDTKVKLVNALCIAYGFKDLHEVVDFKNNCKFIGE